MTLEDSIHSQRLRVLRDAERLKNVSEACRRHGMSRTVFYSGWSSTGLMACTPSATRRAGGVRRPSQSKRSAA